MSNREKKYLAVITSGEWSDTKIYVVGVFASEQEARDEAQKLADKVNCLAKKADEAFLSGASDLEEQLEKEYCDLLDTSCLSVESTWNVSVAKLEGKPYRLF